MVRPARYPRLVALLIALAVIPVLAGEVRANPRARRRARQFWVEEVTPTQGATGVLAQSLTVQLDFSKAIGVRQDLARLAQVRVNGEDALVAVTASEDRRRIELSLVSPPPPGADVTVRLASFVRNARGRRVRMHQPRWVRPLRFRIAPAENSLPPDPTDKGRFLPGVASLEDGRLLLVGGLGSDATIRSDALLGSASATAWSMTPGTLLTARWAPSVASLPDGRALVVGGFTDAAGIAATASVEVFDPASGTFSAAAPLASARGGIVTVRTSDGIVLALGGSAAWGADAATDSIDAWEPFSGSFMPLAERLPMAVTESAVASMRGGAVLVAGGADGAGAVSGTAVVVNPVADAAADTVTEAGTLLTPRRAAGAALLPTGEVLIAGGEDATGARLSSLEAYDPVRRVFRALPGTLSEPRSHCVVVVLANGAVAVVGGVIDAGGNGSRAIDVFDPLTGERVSTYLASRPLAGHAALALPDGTLLLVGGATAATLPPSSSSSRVIVSQAVLGARLDGPRIVAASPSAGASRIDCDASVTVSFSRPLDEASLAGAISLLDGEGIALSGTVRPGAVANEAVFVPSRPLPPNHPVTVTVATSVRDRLGNPLASDGTRSWTFSTAFDVEVGAADDGSQFGYAVASGDVNGDGVDDLVVSGYAAESLPGSGVQPGQIYVLFGRTTQGSASAPILRDLAASTTAADVVITLEDHADQPGIESALQVLDFDRDGFDDIAIGAHFGDGPTETASSQGEVIVIFGQATFTSRSLTLGKSAVSGFDVLRIYGEAAGDKFGEGMSHGDVDGDGYPDLVVGATGVDLFVNAPSNQRDHGAIYVMFGGTKSSLGVVNGFGADSVGAASTTIHNVRLLGWEASDRLGWSCAAGDIDGDGYADPTGGATGGDGSGNARSSAGEAIGIFGASRTGLIPTGRYAGYQGGPSIPIPGFVVHGEDASDFMGWALAAGDLDGDGNDELAIGGTLADGIANAGSNRGEVAVVFGAPRSAWVPAGNWGQVTISSTLTSPRLLRVHGEDDGDAFGDCLRIDDADGDGTRDLLVGGYGADGLLNATGASTGELSVFRGTGLVPSGGVVEFAMSATALPANVTATRFHGKTASDRFGTTIAVGDFDADGRPDIATGANRARGHGRLFQNAGEAYLLWGRASWWR